MTDSAVSELLVWLVCALVCAAPVVAARRRTTVDVLSSLAAVVFIAVALTSPRPEVAYVVMTVVAGVHALVAWPHTRTGAFGLLLAAAAAAATALALRRGAADAAFVCSLLAIALRTGLLPLHVGVAALTERAPRVQTRQLGSAIALVFLHLRHVDHIPLAVELATPLVCYGAASASLSAFMALAARDAVGWLRSSILMHGGLLFCGLGAAGNGHYGAALLAAIALALALGGMGVVVAGLEERCGREPLGDHGGRARALPRLCAAFAVFGGAGVGLPATAGFIADDLLLHALWEESRVSAAAVILASAVLAVATLTVWSKIFLGPPRKLIAPDLAPRERVALTALVLVLLALGLVPQVLMNPVNEVLGTGRSGDRAGDGVVHVAR